MLGEEFLDLSFLSSFDKSFDVLERMKFFLFDLKVICSCKPIFLYREDSVL